ncbi:hypothetical protein F4780DRAFT_736935 [Xylariomycetidae sp. FL0641]|nr:hypothetical protein F4780DRAFT_736935 [Xylariomycetidae sp. FL0641]
MGTTSRLAVEHPLLGHFWARALAHLLLSSITTSFALLGLPSSRLPLACQARLFPPRHLEASGSVFDFDFGPPRLRQLVRTTSCTAAVPPGALDAASQVVLFPTGDRRRRADFAFGSASSAQLCWRLWEAARIVGLGLRAPSGGRRDGLMADGSHELRVFQLLSARPTMASAARCYPTVRGSSRMVFFGAGGGSHGATGRVDRRLGCGACKQAEREAAASEKLGLHVEPEVSIGEQRRQVVRSSQGSAGGSVELNPRRGEVGSSTCKVQGTTESSSCMARNMGSPAHHVQLIEEQSRHSVLDEFEGETRVDCSHETRMRRVHVRVAGW